MDYVCLVFLPRRVFDFLKDYFILGSILVSAMPEGSGYELLTLTASVFGGESVLSFLQTSVFPRQVRSLCQTFIVIGT